MNTALITLGLLGTAAVAGSLQTDGRTAQGARNGAADTHRIQIQVIPLPALVTAWQKRKKNGTATPVFGIAQGASIHPKEALLLEDVEDRVNDAIEEGIDEQGLSRKASTEEVIDRLHADLSDMKTYFERLSFPLSVYRGLLVTPGTAVRAQGESWTPNRAIAEAFANGAHDASEVTRAGMGGQGQSILLGATIPSAADVDWRETFSLFLRYSLGVLGDDRQAEEEVRIKKPAQNPHTIQTWTE